MCVELTWYRVKPCVSKVALCETYIKSSPKLRKAQLYRHTNVTRYRVTLNVMGTANLSGILVSISEPAPC